MSHVKESKFTLANEGTSLSGEVFIPQNSHPKGGLIICHGIPGGGKEATEKNTGYDYLGRLFSKQGFISLIFNFSGTGESGGNLDMSSWVKDLDVAIDYYYKKYYMPSLSLTIIGFSAGAAVAVEVAAKDPCINALALGACPANFEFFLEKFTGEQLWDWFNITGLFRSPEDMPDKEIWLERFLSIRPEKEISKIAPRNLLIMHGDKDETVPPEHAEILYSRAGKGKKLVTFPEITHRMRSYREVINCLQTWLEEVNR